MLLYSLERREMRCHTRNVNQTQVKLTNNNRHVQRICFLFCTVSIEFPCAVQRLAEDLFLLYNVPYSKSVARGAFLPFLDIIALNIPYCESTILYVVPLLVQYYHIIATWRSPYWLVVIE